MTAPTPQDHDNASRRAAIAEHFRKLFDEARHFAEQAFGPGWIPVGRHDLVEHGEAERCRRTGEKPKFDATAIDVVKDGERRCFSLVDGVPIAVLDFREAFGPMLTEPDPDRTFTDQQGQTHPLGKYGLYWSGYEPNIRPRTAEQLAEARSKREARALEREAQASPLFADVIREQGVVPKRRSR